jgi:predicted permease
MWKLLRRIGYWLRYRQNEKDLTEELEFHRSLKQQDLERNGMPAADAALHSRRALGNTLDAIERSRETWAWSWLDQFVRDARIGARSLLKAPGFTVFSTLILSIGIGATVIIFGYINSVFFKRLNIPNQDAFVKIYGAGEGAPIGTISYSAYERYRDSNRSLAQIGMFAASRTRMPLRAEGPRTLPLDMVQPTIVSSGLFKAIGVRMVLGRGIEPQDERTGAPNVVVLNEEAWARYFAREPDILNKTLYLNNTPYTIVGVAPKPLHDALSLFPTSPGPELCISVRENTLPRLVNAVGRLAPGVSRTEAQADLSRIAAQLAVEKRDTVTVTVERADVPPSWFVVGLASLASLFLVVVFSVLLIACDDIAIMLLARVAARQREMGIRVALGGSRTQLVRQLVSENILMSILGGTGAMIFALLAARLIERLPISVPEASRAVFDWRVLVFTVLTSLATTLFFGLRPALECVSRDVVASLYPGAKSGSQRQARVRSNLVVAQIAFCTALLIIAAVAARSVTDITFAQRGYKTDHLVTADINFVGTAYNRDSQVAFYRELLPRLASTPGIESVCIVSNSENLDTVQTVAGSNIPVERILVDEGYFRTLQIPLIAGRGFTPQDDLNSAPVGIINERMAKTLFPTESPIGRTIRTGDGTLVEIVGVARDIIHGTRPIVGLSANIAKPALYRPINQVRTVPPNTVYVRFSGAEATARRAILEKVTQADSSLLVYNIATLDDQLEQRLLPLRVIGYVIGIPGLLTLLLGTVGTYGTVAILVAQRRREVGIRIALGAHPSGAVRLILREGMKSASIGVGIGMAMAAIAVLWLSRNIVGPDFFQPLPFATMTLLVMAAAGMACYIPARRVSRVDPMVVLRED